MFTACVWLLYAVASASPDVVFDVREPSHEFLGFGTQVWAGDVSVEPVLRDLNMRYVRISTGHFGGNLDVDGWGDAEHDAALAGETWDAHKATGELLQRYDVEMICNVFGAPENWLVDKPRKNTLNPDYYEHYAKRLVAVLLGLCANGVRPLGIEIFNEQDGTWNCYVPPEGYKRIVKLLRHELDKRGLHELLIFGPGIAHIDTGNKERWIEALDQEAADMIGAWSIHGYQWDKRRNQDPGYARDSYRSGFEQSLLKKDPERRKPVFITEFSPLKLYDDEDNAVELPDFPARAVEDALSFLNSGAGAVLFWEAADMSWSPDRHHGLIRLDKTPRPVFEAFRCVFAHVPPGAQILKAPEQPGGEVYAAAFRDEAAVVVALVNSTTDSRTQVVRIAGADALEVEDVCLFGESGAPDQTVEMAGANAFAVQVPALGVVCVRLVQRDDRSDQSDPTDQSD